MTAKAYNNRFKTSQKRKKNTQIKFYLVKKAINDEITVIRYHRTLWEKNSKVH